MVFAKTAALYSNIIANDKIPQYEANKYQTINSKKTTSCKNAVDSAIK